MENNNNIPTPTPESVENSATSNGNGNGESKCPFMSGILTKGAGGGTSNREWWPNQLKLNNIGYYLRLLFLMRHFSTRCTNASLKLLSNMT